MRNLLLIFILCFSTQAHASKCKDIRTNNAPNSNTVNLIFVPSGFENDLKTFEDEALNYSSYLGKFVPFDQGNEFLGIKISLTEDKQKNSYCEFDCKGIPRLLCCDYKIAKKLAKPCKIDSKKDQVIVIHNSDRMGGGGYLNRNMATVPLYSKEVLVHELGHSLFKLADEYPQTNHDNKKPNCDLKGCSKWSDLIDEGIQGAECTASGCAKGAYFTCGSNIMKYLGFPFLANNERLTCCHYKHLTKNYPSYCNKYKKAGVGLDNFCKSQEILGSYRDESDFPILVEYFNPGDPQSGIYEISK